MSDHGRVLVLAGGLSHERDVSLRSGRRVTEALRDAGVEVELADLDESLPDRVRANPPAVVVPVLHGGPGEDGSLREVLELMGLPYLGAAPMACRAAFDKPTAATIVAKAGIAVPESVVLPRSTFTDLGARQLLDAVVAKIGLPLIVKPTRGGSSLGVTVVTQRTELAAAMVSCFAYGEEAVVQRFVSGTEIAVCVVERDGVPAALPLVEIDTAGAAYDYEARYTAGEATFFVPARLDEDAQRRSQEAGITAHKVLGLRHLSRTDLIVDDTGTPWFLEVNVSPGMTETSVFPQAIEANGETMAAVMTSLIDAAVRPKGSTAG